MSRQPLQLCKNEFETELRQLVNFLWVLGEDVSYAELASKANLSVSTLTNLFNGTTKSPHLKTILKIGRALGIDLTIKGKQIHVETTERVRPVGRRRRHSLVPA